MIEKLFNEFSTVLNPKSLLLSKGDTLFRQGDGVHNFYFIKRGKVKLIRNTVDGSPVILHVGQQGEAIAEASLFSDQYHCSAVADVDSKVLFMKKNNIVSLLNKNPNAMMALLAIFSRQVRDLRAINELKNIRSARERILTFIKTNANNNKQLTSEISLKDMAQKIGLAHETFYRELKNLESDGIIKRDSNQITLI